MASSVVPLPVVKMPQPYPPPRPVKEPPRSTAAADNPYLVWVAPGVYEEQVTMKPYVHLQGAGQEATVISSTASSSAWPPTQATLLLASDTSLRDLDRGQQRRGRCQRGPAGDGGYDAHTGGGRDGAGAGEWQ